MTPAWRSRLWRLSAFGAAWVALGPMMLAKGAPGLVGAVGGLLLVTMVAGRGLMRVLACPVPADVAWAAALPVGLALMLVLAAWPLGLGLGGAAQGMALVTVWVGLALAAVWADPVEQEPGAGRWLQVFLPAGAALAAALPVIMQGAWSLPGHDLDTLQHQDGAIHAMLIHLASQGVAAAPGYPLGMHAWLSGVGQVLGWNAFESLCVGMPLAAAAAVSATQWQARAWGAGASTAAGAGALMALHPLLGFVQAEQFGPQLCAVALCSAVAASCMAQGHRSPRVPVLPAVVLGGVVSVYPLALAVAGPLACACAWSMAPRGRRGLHVARLVGLAVLLAPWGGWRVAQRLGGGAPAQSPIRAASRSAEGAGAPKPMFLPDAHGLGQPREATQVLKWDTTWAHLAGVTPYRDNFFRTARLFQAYLGRDRATWLTGPLEAWVAVGVPLGALLWAGLFVWAWIHHVRRGWGVTGWSMAACLPGVVAVLWLGQGQGIAPYYGFKLASLLAGPITAGAAAGWGLVQLKRGWRLGWGCFWVASRLTPCLALHLEYSRGLALDHAWTQMVEPVMRATAHQPAAALDPSPTRKYWNSRLLLARARETDPDQATFLFCARTECPTGAAVVVVRHGPYALWRIP